MIIYTRFNCLHHNIEKHTACKTNLGEHAKTVDGKDVGRAKRRMRQTRFDGEWLKERLRLFRMYCAPSVAGQTSQDYRWIGIIDPATPGWFAAEIQKIAPRMEIAFSELDLNVAVRDGDPLSMNIDSDDAIPNDFVEIATILSERYEDAEFNFPRGFKYRELTNVVISCRTDNSHFNVVKHPKYCVLDFSHGMSHLFRNKDIIDLRRGMWLEVIHEANVANKLRKKSKDKNLGLSVLKDRFNIDYKTLESREFDCYGRSDNPDIWQRGDKIV